jgi:SAM-dependent methyltransferase
MVSEFAQAMGAVLSRHKVNVVNVSVRHALADERTVLTWARGETFAFVLYYKQHTDNSAKEQVAVWTRELIDAVLAVGGTYYLPYQVHATDDQFHRAYPKASEMFALKAELDPHYRLRGALWDRYYTPWQQAMRPIASPTHQSLFAKVYSNQREADRFYAFLKNIFHLMPEERLHALIKAETNKHDNDEAVYRGIQAGAKSIAPTLGMLTHALPSLAAQKAEMGRQTAKLIGNVNLRDYVEIGTTGRYVRTLRQQLKLSGKATLVHDVAPGMSPVDIVERGQLGKIADFVALNDYAPITLPPKSADLVSCFVGLHHMAPAKLTPFLESIANIVRPGGFFVVRDHDVLTPEMDAFVSLAHAVFNSVLGETWETNQKELRRFASVDEWIARIEAVGFRHTGSRLRQDGDPSDNILMAFERVEEPA